MKKSLLAVAAMGAFASAAQAQSSVTVYGILDVGFQSATSKTNGTPNAVGGAAGNNQAVNTYNTGTTTGTAFGQSAETTSRLGFRGTEDLGGGNSAFFTFETNLQPNSSVMSSMTNRQSFVGLAQKGLGRASIGTQYTPIHEAIGQTDPGQQNNMPGNVIYNANPTGSNFPGSRLPTQQQFAYTNNLGGASAGPDAYTHRVSNSIRFATDNFAGFVGKVIYAQNSSDTNAISPTAVAGAQVDTGGYNNFTGWGLGVDYSGIKKLIATANYQTFKADQFAITTVAASATAGAGQTSTATVYSPTSNGSSSTQANSVDNQAYLAATYDFGILKAYAQYINRKSSAVTDANVYAKRTGQQIGVRSYVTPTIEPWASVGTGKITNSYYSAPAGTQIATQSASANVFGWQLGSNYWLSKRTNLYAIYGLESTGNTVYPQTANGSSANLNAVSNRYSSYAVGVRHTF